MTQGGRNSASGPYVFVIALERPAVSPASTPSTPCSAADGRWEQKHAGVTLTPFKSRASFLLNWENSKARSTFAASNIVWARRAPGGGKAVPISGSTDFGRMVSNALPDYGMYLKAQSNDKFDPIMV